MPLEYTKQQLKRQRDYWRGKASERQYKINRMERELNQARMARQGAEDRLQSYLGTPASRALDVKDREIADLQGKLSRSKQVGDHLSKMLREARQRERDAEERADHLRDKLSQSTTRNVELGRQIETLSASVGDLDVRDASIHDERRRGPYERRVSPVEDRRMERDDRAALIDSNIDRKLEEHVDEWHSRG